MSKTEMIEWIIRWVILCFALVSLVFASITWRFLDKWQDRSLLVVLGLTDLTILVHAAGMLFIYYSR